MTALATAGAHRGPRASRLPAAVIGTGVVVVVAAMPLMGSTSILILAAGMVALAIGVCALINPVLATILLLVTMFLRLPIRAAVGLPVELFLIAFAGVAVSTVLWMDRTPDRLRGLGSVGWAMVAYLTWNVYSMFTPHQYVAADPVVGERLSVTRLIVMGSLIPFAMYLVGRYAFDRKSAVRALLWAILALAAFSAVVSIMPSIGLADWVWPRYIVEIQTPGWAGRAVGIFNQPVVNGMVLALGVAIAMLLAARRDEPAWQRRTALVIGIASGIGVYETHTRAAWLGALAVLLIGALLATGYRTGFVVALLLVITTVAANWSTFTSADREAGGVGSLNEVDSRLNDIRTAFWAFERKPLEGWGIGRFQSVNTYHHQQWSVDTAFSLGYGEVSHQNELAILAELGIIGLTAWICVLTLAAIGVWRAYRTLPDAELCGKPLAVLAMMAMAILISAGMTVDLRFFEFAITVIFLLIGIAIGWADRTSRTPAGAGGILRPTVQHHV